jgi:hypothetical protein
MRTEPSNRSPVTGNNPFAFFPDSEKHSHLRCSETERLRLVVIGNLRVGDTLWAWKLFQEVNAFNLAICNRYNYDAVTFLRDHVLGANVDGIICVDEIGADLPLHDIPSYHRWVERFVPYFYPAASYVPWEWDTDMTPWPAVVNLTPHRDCQDFIVYQLRSNSEWKRWDALDKLTLPSNLHAYTIGDPGSFTKGTPWQGKSLRECAELLLGAKGILGNPSSMTVLSTLLGVPSVVCSPWEETWHNEPPHLKHLFQPTETQILDAARSLGVL